MSSCSYVYDFYSVYLVLHLRVAKSKWPKKVDSFSCTNVAFIFIKQIRMREMMYTYYDTVVYVVYVYCIACTIVEFIFNLLKYLYRKLDLLEMTIS